MGALLEESKIYVEDDWLSVYQSLFIPVKYTCMNNLNFSMGPYITLSNSNLPHLHISLYFFSMHVPVKNIILGPHQLQKWCRSSCQIWTNSFLNGIPSMENEWNIYITFLTSLPKEIHSQGSVLQGKILMKNTGVENNRVWRWETPSL